MKPHAHTRMLTHSNMQTHIYHVDTESTWDLERERGISKRREKPTDVKQMCWKLDTASFSPYTVANAVHMCTSTLSGCGRHPLQSQSIRSLQLKRTERATSPASIPSEDCREHSKDGEMRRRLTFSWGSRRGQLNWLVTLLSVSGLWWNLKY